jgi:hypothetical protein
LCTATDFKDFTMYSNIGKFEGRKLVAEFDALLIQLYGLNMTDAKITRQDAVAAITELGSARKAVEVLSAARGLQQPKAA